SLGNALLQITLKTAPLVLLGLGASACMQAVRSRVPGIWLAPRGSLRDGVQGVLAAALLPRASGSPLRIGQGLEERRASFVFVVAFLLATPALGLETFALSVGFLGWELAGVRLGGAVAMALVAAVSVGMF